MQDIKPILEKALTHLSAGKMSAAIAQCKKALHKAPNNFDALHLFGVALLKSKRHTEASQALTKAVSQQAPNRQKAMAYSNLSLSQLYAGFSHKALESIDNSLGLAPQSPESLANRIIILESIERWDALLATYDRLARLQPPPPALRLSRVIAARALNRYAEAFALLDADTELTSLQDGAMEWVMLSLLTDVGAKANVNEQLSTKLSQANTQVNDALNARDFADYCAENHQDALAKTAYQAWLTQTPDDTHAQHMLNALSGAKSSVAPASYVSDLYDQHAEQFEQRLQNKLGYDAPQRIVSSLAPFLTSLATATGAPNPSQVSKAEDGETSSQLAEQHLGTPETQQNSKIRCLDLGCGTGLVADALTPYAGDLELTGVDLSAGMLKLAKDKARYRHLIQADLTKFSAPAGHYHIIIAADVFIYLGDLKPVFTKVANLLSPEGLFAFTLEAGDSHTQLMKSGRFSHSTQYIDHLITNTQFTTLSQQRFALRLENNEPVEGLLYLVQKAI